MRLPMKPIKKITSLCLCVVLVLTLLPAAALAVQTYTTSPSGVAMIEKFEGFRNMPYSDDKGNWYIGYGSQCNPADYPFGITEAQADVLLRQDLASKEEAVNRLLVDYNISVTQYQFDAMVSMTYTLGTQWMNPTYRFCGYLIRGIQNYSEVEVVNAIATWCHSGDDPLDHLVERRLQEAYLFLYGTYENDAAQRYRYIHFDPNGGDVENKTVFYPIGTAYGQLPTPTGNGGRTFLGWYTSDGTKLTGQELAMENVWVTAKWDGESSGSSGSDIDLSGWVNPYSDVKETDWYFTYVRELSAKGVVGGYPDGTFQGTGTLTAGEALKLIMLATGNKEQAPTGSHWASGYLTLAESLGCVAPGEIQNLDSPISRLTIARVAAVAMGISARRGASPFADVDDGYTLALYEEGILNGTVVGGKRYYYPNEGINRAEVCAIVSRINNWKPTVKNDPAQSGYISYGNKYYPVLPNVPACPYNTNLLVLDGSRMYYNDPGYTTAFGIDVSSHQKEIDWQKVAASGVEFAIIRLGYRGYGSEGTVNLDPYFKQNLAGAKAAGLKVGVYFFSQAITTQEAAEEAQFVLTNLAGAQLDYPVVYDWEPISGVGARTDGLDSVTLTDCAITFCETVSQAGYTPMVYYNNPVGYGRYDLSRLTAYDVWFAQYASKPTMYYNYRIWQYTSSGKVPGISTKVDMNIAFIPY